MKILSPNAQQFICANALIRLCGILMLLCVTAGCSSKVNKVPLMQIPPEEFPVKKPDNIENQPTLLKTSLNDKRPEWAHKSSFEKGDSIYFTGAFIGGADFSMTQRAANAEALKQVAQAIGQIIRAQFSMYTKGSNQIGEGIDRYIEDGIATFSKDLHIQGIRQKESFYEEMWDPSLMQSFYNVWVKLELSKRDYLRSQARALARLKDALESSGQIEVKEKAQQLLHNLKGEINEIL